MVRFGFMMAAAFALTACSPSGEGQDAMAPACDYDCTLERHIASIQQGDWDAFVATITADPAIQLILPDGTLVEGREAYLELLEPWLTEGGFTFGPETIDQRVGADLGYSLLRITQRTEGETEPSTYFLLLVFAIENGEWRLVHDQNTRISAPVSEAGAENDG